jgi:hypothetical protein
MARGRRPLPSNREQRERRNKRDFKTEAWAIN